MRDARGFAAKAFPRSGLRAAVSLLTCFLPTAALAQTDESVLGSHGLSYMTGYGPKNYPVVSLLWGEIILSLAVVAVVALLVFLGVLFRRRRIGIEGLSAVPLERSGSGLPFIYVGVALTFVALLVYAVWNYEVLAAVATPPRDAALTLKVTGHLWWWEVQYQRSGSTPGFTTANEIHIPVGKPVKVELTTADVIHSFWVPALTGKMDTIPGQRNETWMQADKAGTYRGQCTEYCGLQHAHMAFTVIAQPEQQFAAWKSEQLRGPKNLPKGRGAAAAHGQQVFMQHCAACHTVRGTTAMGKIGPDLSHLMERATIAAGTLPNTMGSLSGWISDPQHVKPGNLMPKLDLAGPELASLREFLKTLQ